MITIQIDEQACVSCTLCVDACPTHVFTFDEIKEIPIVTKPAECFGCLACSQECPSDAISHEGVSLSKDFYRDPYAVQLAAKICGLVTEGGHGVNEAPVKEGAADETTVNEAAMNEASLKRGLDDLGVRLLSLGAVLKETLSTGLPAVGSLAGKTLATQLPRYQVPASTLEALALAQEQFGPAWELHPVLEGDAITIVIKGCFVRDVCAKKKLELGGELCVLFANYLMGYLGKATGLRLRLMQTNRDWKGCSYEAKVYR